MNSSLQLAQLHHVCTNVLTTRIIGCCAGCSALASPDCRLHTLNISCCALANSSIEPLTRLLEGRSGRTSLTILKCSDNGIDDGGGTLLAKALSTNSTLRSLDLSGNNIGTAGAKVWYPNAALGCSECMHGFVSADHFPSVIRAATGRDEESKLYSAAHEHACRQVRLRQDAGVSSSCGEPMTCHRESSCPWAQ